jgi:hypothetical protein
VKPCKFSTPPKRYFAARRIEDIPATLRHHVRGVAIVPSQVGIKIIDEGLLDLTFWINSLKEERIEQNRRMQTMHQGMALQGTMQAILMCNGLYDRAVKLNLSLMMLKKAKLDIPQVCEISSELSACLINLQPYYDGKKFIFDFDPPYYLLSQN